jgi:hypothetical protein
LISSAGTVTNAALSSAASTSSGFNFSVKGTAASLYVVVASTNLTYWVTVATNASPFVFTDSNASKYSRRFYQAILASAYVPQVAPAQPVTSPPLSSPASAPRGFTFTVNNTVGSPYVIVASTNLTYWVAIGTNTAPFTFTDTNSSKFSRRFYKAILASAYVPQVAPAQPVTSPPLSSPASAPGGFTFTVNNTVGSPYVIVASTNLTYWVAIGTNTAPFTFTDTNSSKYSRRFYKVILQSAYVPQVAPAPSTAAALSAYSYGSAGFSFNLTGTPGSFYIVEVSTNLVNWVPMLTNAAPFNFVDSNASKFSCRFYQAVPLP